MRSQRSDKWSNETLFNDLNTYSTTNYSDDYSAMNVDTYHVYTGHLLLDTVYEREYLSSSPAGGNMQTITSYQYNPNNLQVSSIRTKQSNGDITEKKITYSCDNSGNVFDIMNQQNMLSVPVTENNYLTNGSFSAAPVSVSTNSFSQLSNGDVKPTTVSTTKYLTPGSATGNFNDIQAMEYDNSGNLTGVKDQESGRTITNIYDYDDKFVTATVINADAATDKPAYTSFETGVTGGWSLSGTPVFTTTQAFTGIQALQLSSALSASINAAKQYTLSFWATGILSVSSGTLTKSGPTLRGFTYYEFLIQNTAAVSVSGSATIDELRLYPKTARMKTVAYDPIIGKISECDENNKVTYYGYDNLGRLSVVKDEQNNVLKTYTYNTSMNQQGCPVTYYNKAISETIAANNCQGDNIGNQITYTIAANKYSSTISQADADSKAEQELNSTGQTQANNAGCTTVYYNDEQSGQFLREDCQVGYKGQMVTYSVPARRYSSLISKDDANQKALDEINANGDAFANDPANSNCIIDTAGQWEATDPEQSRCSTTNPWHEEVYMQNVNPNSLDYNTFKWIDAGVDSVGCPYTPPAPPFTVGPAFKYISGTLSLSGNTVNGTITFQLVSVSDYNSYVEGDGYIYLAGLTDGNNIYYEPSDTRQVYTSYGNCRITPGAQARLYIDWNGIPAAGTNYTISFSYQK